jgi:hypothetical protein
MYINLPLNILNDCRATYFGFTTIVRLHKLINAIHFIAVLRGGMGSLTCIIKFFK